MPKHTAKGEQKMKTVKMTTNQTVRIPTYIVERLRLPEDTMFDVKTVDDGILLTPLANIPRSQLYFWTEEWQKGEREADEDIRKGNYRGFDDVEDFIADLDS